ncbi:MAG TPA: T9SS sorting signal type C domain-containing protein [Flavobacterium sp.]|nr:T9SS sorting signal type C domain-containing protein [Flavobacterium sp.]
MQHRYNNMQPGHSATLTAETRATTDNRRLNKMTLFFYVLAACLVFGWDGTAQTTYYSKPFSTNFANRTSWGVNGNGSGAAPAAITNADNYVIRNGANMVLNASASVRQLTIENGSLSIGSNTLTVSSATGNNTTLSITSSGSLSLSNSGTLVLNGNLTAASGAILSQSGGDIIIDGNNNGIAASSVATGTPLFSFTSASAINLYFTGGRLIIVDPHVGSGASDQAFVIPSGTCTSNGSHRLVLGDGVSTTEGGALAMRVSIPTTLTMGSLDINTGSGVNRYANIADSFRMNGSLTVTSGEFRILATAGLQLSGNLTNNGTLSTLGSIAFTGSSNQTVSGNGVFQNALTDSKANFSSLECANTNGGVTFSNVNSLLSGSNTGTVSGMLTLTSGTIDTLGLTFIVGTGQAWNDDLSFISGGFAPTAVLGRWFGVDAGLASFYMVGQNGTKRRDVTVSKTASATGGIVRVGPMIDANNVSYNSILDNDGYTVNLRSNTGWTVGQTGITGSATFDLSFDGEDIYAPLQYAPINSNHHVTLANTPAPGNHASGTNYIKANRVGIPLANLADTYYIGSSFSDINTFGDVIAFQSGDWSDPTIWSTGSVPTSGTGAFIPEGRALTVSGTTNAKTLNVRPGSSVTISSGTFAVTDSVTTGGSITVNGGDFNIGGGSGTGMAVNTGGSLTLSSGAVTIGPAGGGDRTFLLNGSFTLSGGTFTLNGNFKGNSGSSFTQSGGEMVVDGNAGGNAVGSVQSGNKIFDFTASTIASLGLSAGHITIVDPHVANGASTLSISIASGIGFPLSHVFRFGNGVSTDAGGNQGFYFTTSNMFFGDIEIETGSGTNRFVFSPQVDIAGDLTITSGEIRTNLLNTGGSIFNEGIATIDTLWMRNADPTAPAQLLTGNGVYRNDAVVPTATFNRWEIYKQMSAPVTTTQVITIRDVMKVEAGSFNFSNGAYLVIPLNSRLEDGPNNIEINGEVRMEVPTVASVNEIPNASPFFSSVDPLSISNYGLWFSMVGNGISTVWLSFKPHVNSVGRPFYGYGLASRKVEVSVLTGAANISAVRVYFYALVNEPSGIFRSNDLEGVYYQPPTFFPERSTVYMELTPSQIPGYYALAEKCFNTVWNGTSWSNGAPNDYYDPFYGIPATAVFEGDYNASADFFSCGIIVNSGNVTVGSVDANGEPVTAYDFDLSGPITVNGGSLTFEQGSNLLQSGYAFANSGPVTFKTNVKIWRQDYVYWGSPVSGQKLFAFSPLTLWNRFYTYNVNSSSFVPVFSSASDPTIGTYDFVTGRGYMVRAPNNFPNPPFSGASPTTLFTSHFTGVPNNGRIAVPTVNGTNYNHIISNPFPSTVDADTFLATNPGSLYFWAHHNQLQGGSNYAMYNNTGATAAFQGGMVPNGTIQVGQGFVFSNTSNLSAVNFTPDMRTGNNQGQFFRSAVSGENSRFWLNIESETSKGNQMLLAYLDTATMGEDVGYDGRLLPSGNCIATMIGGERYGIQARSSFDDNDIVPMALHAETTGTMIISFDHADGVFAGEQGIFLKDNITGDVTNLKETPYSFTTAAGDFNDRFQLQYTNTTLGTSDVMKASVAVYADAKGTFTIHSPSSGIDNVEVYDIRGRRVYMVKASGETELPLTTLVAEKQVLLLKITLSDGSVVTRKVLN